MLQACLLGWSQRILFLLIKQELSSHTPRAGEVANLGMWLTLYPVALALALLWLCLPGPGYSLHVSLLCVALYLLHYVTYVYRVNWPRPWPWFRSLALWDHMHRRHLGLRLWAESRQWKDYSSSTQSNARIFVVHASEHAALAALLTFGLHGTEPSAVCRCAPLIVLPDSLLQLPFIANVCQWAGGVALDSVLLSDHLAHGGSLVLLLSTENDALFDWIPHCPQTCSSALMAAVLYKGSENFYASLGPLHLGLCGTCAPRMCHLRVGVYTARPIVEFSTGEPLDSRALSEQMLADHNLMKAILE